MVTVKNFLSRSKWTFGWITLVHILIGFLLMGIGMPLVWGVVPPNPWYGLRIPQTLSDPAIWYPANAYAGRLLVTTGILMILVSLILPHVKKLTRSGYILTWTIIMILSLAVTLFLSWIYTQTLKGTIKDNSIIQSLQPHYLQANTLLLLLLSYILVGLLLIGLAMPLIQRKVKPNVWYGLRLSQTMNDERVWYQANEYSGRLLLYVGVTLIVVASLLAVIPIKSLETYSIICFGVLVGGLLLVTWLSWRYVHKISK